MVTEFATVIRHKKRAPMRPPFKDLLNASALARFKTALGFVYDVYAALAAHDATVAVPVFERAE